MTTKNRIIAIIGALLLVASLIALTVVGLPTFDGETVSFTADGNELKGTYHHVEGSERAVLLCGGFSSDRQMLRPFANLFVKSGITVMTFDYSGHGGSSGTVGFDNATNGQIAREIDIAIDELSRLSGVAEENIILLGHSMGGRSILELYTSENKPKSTEIVLVSLQINYDNNTQSTAFTGVNDADIAPWDSLSQEATEGISVTLVGSYADDIVSTESMQVIFNRLSDSGNADNVTLSMVDGVFHSYMVYSTQVADAVLGGLGIENVSTSPLAVMYYAWFVSAVGIFMILLGVSASLGKTTVSSTIILTNYRKFITRKLLIFLPSLLVMAVIASVAVLMPFGAPIMSIAFIGGIAGYGILSFLFYRLKKISGIEGTIEFSFKTGSTKQLVIAIGIAAAVLFVLVYILGSGLYNLFPLNMRLFWLGFAGLVMSIGFYIGDCEGDMLKTAGATAPQMLFYNVVQYLLLFLMGAAYLVIGSYSGLIGLVQNLVLMYICIFTGKIVGKLTNRPLGSLTSAFLFQSMILTSTCLMVVF